MKGYRRLIVPTVWLILGGMAALAGAESSTDKPRTPWAPESTTAPPARLYFIEADTLGEEELPEELQRLRDRELEGLKGLEALEVLEALEGLEALEVLDALEAIPDFSDEIILPDTVYTTEITIGPEGIEYYDTTGERTVIVGRPVSPDAPFIFSEEGGRMITTKRAADIVQIGVDVHIDRDERVEGDVVVIGGSIEVLGEVKGDVVAVLGDVFIDGYVHGSAFAPTGKVEITSSGRVRRNVTAAVIDDKPGSRIGGHKSYSHTRLPTGFDRTNVVYVTMLFFIGLAVFLIFLILLGHVFAGKNIAVIKSRISGSGIKSFFVGLITEILGIPVLFVLLLITVIGIPVALIALPITIVVAAVLGYAAFGLLLGEKLVENTSLRIKSQLGRSMAGITAMLLVVIFGSLLAMISAAPLSVTGWVLFGIGQAIVFIATTTGLGAVVLTRFGTRLKKAPAKQSTPAPSELLPGSGESSPAPA